MIINCNDKYIGRSIEQFGSWAADDIDLIKSIIQIQLQDRNQIIFYDIGANIGTHSVALARHFSKQIKIRAFEAQRHVYYALCGNVALNGLDNVICEHLAVSDGINESIEVCMPDYQVSNNFGGLELMPAVNSDNRDMIMDQTERIKCVTIDHFNECVDFIKLDIEGMEIQALAGAEATINKSQPICFVEVLKSDRQAIQNFFSDLEYQGYGYKNDDWIFLPKHSDVDLDLPKVLL